MARWIAALLMTAGTPQETKTASLPTVRPASGALQVWQPPKDSPAPVRDSLEVGPADRLGTSNGEPATFVTDTDALVTLRGVVVRKNKGLGLLRRGEALVLQLFDGTVLVDSVEAQLAVETPNGKVEAKAALFLVEVTKKETRVVALSGTLTFSNALGSVSLDDGMESGAGAGEKPSAGKPRGPSPDLLGGSENLIRNPGFENDLADWEDDSGNSAKVDAKVFYAGKQAVRFDVKGRAGKTTYLSFQQNPPLVIGERYLIRCFIRADARRGLKGTWLEVQRGSRESDACFRPAAGKWMMHRVLFTARMAQPHPLIGLDVEGDEIDATVWADEYFLVRLPK
jgi:hypothetical protein